MIPEPAFVSTGVQVAVAFSRSHNVTGDHSADLSEAALVGLEKKWNDRVRGAENEGSVPNGRRAEEDAESGDA